MCQESELENLQSQIQVMIDFCYLCLGVSNPNSDRFNPLQSKLQKVVFLHQNFIVCCLVFIHQVAQEQTEEAQNMQKRLNNETPVNSNNGTSGQSAKVTPASIAAMAEMLSSSTNSSMIMHSVFSSFAAEATQTSGLTKSNSADTNAFPPPNPQYHLIQNPAASQQFIPYGFGNIPLMPPGQLPPPPGSLPPHMMSNQQNAAQQQSQQGPSFQPPGMMYFGPPHHS